MPTAPDATTGVRRRQCLAWGLAGLALSGPLAACRRTPAPWRWPATPSGLVPWSPTASVDERRLDLTFSEVAQALRPTFGELTEARYLLQPAPRPSEGAASSDARTRLAQHPDWARIQQHYDQALAPTLQRYTAVYAQGRRHRLAVWSAQGQAHAPVLGLAWVDASPSDEAPSSPVLLVIGTPPSP